MRKPVIAGNWKMNKTTVEAVKLSQSISYRFDESWEDVDVVLCPPFTDIKSVRNVLDFDHSSIALGAQDVYWEESGAYTGCISAHMLEELLCTFCIVGHSERREYFGETNADVKRKIDALLSHNITPIVCVGESLEVRDSGEYLDYIASQVREGFDGMLDSELKRCVVAYEPIWAIGTGRAATPEQAEEVCAHIRAVISEISSAEVAQAVRILYGGSMKPANVDAFMPQPNIDGGLIGGAALDADDFATLVKAARNSLS